MLNLLPHHHPPQKMHMNNSLLWYTLLFRMRRCRFVKASAKYYLLNVSCSLLAFCSLSFFHFAFPILIQFSFFTFAFRFPFSNLQVVKKNQNVVNKCRKACPKITKKMSQIAIAEGTPRIYSSIPLPRRMQYGANCDHFRDGNCLWMNTIDK